MPWARGSFKGKDVWVEVQADGSLVVNRGMVNVRYLPKEDATIYRGSMSNLVYQPGRETQALTPATRPSGFGSAGSRTAEQTQAAAVAARELLATLRPGTHVAFADGACKGNPGPAGSGAFVELADGRKAEASVFLGHQTNNVGELSAIGLVLDLLDQAGVPAEQPVAILSDSSYARGVLLLNWKAKANTELVKDLRARLKTRSGAQIYWVAGHSGVAGNERADALANDGSAGRTFVRWF
jgi:ribonuclease HI